MIKSESQLEREKSERYLFNKKKKKEVIKLIKESQDKLCSKCLKGKLIIKKGKFGEFFACNRFPLCSFAFKAYKQNNFNIKDNEQKCVHSEILKKQLFNNKSVHLVRICEKCRKILIPNYAPKTKENLKSAIGWVKESEETKLLDELLGLNIKEIKTTEIKENYICGNCKNNCGECRIKSFCPCHWK